MGGPKKENIAKEQSYADQQYQLGQQLNTQSQQSLAKQGEYEAPLVNFLKSMMSGNSGTRLSAAAIPIGQIAQGAQQARESIYDSVPAGVGRDFALAGLKRDQYAQTSGLLNQSYLNSFPALAGLGSGNAQIGLQLQGAGLRAGEAGASGINSINNRDAQTKASTMGLIGGLAGAAGNVATGGLYGAAKNAGGYATNVLVPYGSK